MEPNVEDSLYHSTAQNRLSMQRVNVSVPYFYGGAEERLTQPFSHFGIGGGRLSSPALPFSTQSDNPQTSP